MPFKRAQNNLSWCSYHYWVLSLVLSTSAICTLFWIFRAQIEIEMFYIVLRHKSTCILIFLVIVIQSTSTISVLLIFSLDVVTLLVQLVQLEEVYLCIFIYHVFLQTHAYVLLLIFCQKVVLFKVNMPVFVPSFPV